MYDPTHQVQLNRIEHKLDELLGRIAPMPIDMTKLNAAAAAVEAELKDLRAKVAAVPTTDPADQAAVDALADKLAADAAPPTS